MGILVSGGAGYIGSHVALELLALGEEIVVLDDFSVGRQLPIPEGVTRYLGDIADTKLVERLIDAHDIKTVIHLAAYTSIDGSVNNPHLAYLTNTAKSTMFLNTIAQAGVKQFIYTSSAAVYGNNERARESDVLTPTSPYGHSLAMFERIVADICNASNIKYAILRCFNVAGADEQLRIGQWPESSNHLIKVVSEAVVGNRDSISIHSWLDNDQRKTSVRDYTHVTDMAKGHVAALHYIRKNEQSIVTNLGSGKGHSVNDIVDMAKSITGSEFIVEHVDRRAGDAEFIIADASHAKEILGWSAVRDIENILETAINWEKRLLEIANAQSMA